MKLLYLRKQPLEAVVIAYLFFIGLVGIPYEDVGHLFTQDAVLAGIYGMIVCRVAAWLILRTVLYHIGLWDGMYSRGRVGVGLLCSLPALAVCVNNLPIAALMDGTAYVTAPMTYIPLFAGECLAVAAFEELAFRGLILPLFLQRFGTDRKGRFISVLFSSALFGLMHLANLLGGADVGSTILQVGYSFLIGCMLGVVYFGGGSLIRCIFLHAIYNFGGMLIPTLGEGGFYDIWTTGNIVVTAALAVCAAAFLCVYLYKVDGEPTRRLITFHDAMLFRKRV